MKYSVTYVLKMINSGLFVATRWNEH